MLGVALKILPEAFASTAARDPRPEGADQTQNVGTTETRGFTHTAQSGPPAGSLSYETRSLVRIGLTTYSKGLRNPFTTVILLLDVDTLLGYVELSRDWHRDNTIYLFFSTCSGEALSQEHT